MSLPAFTNAYGTFVKDDPLVYDKQTCTSKENGNVTNSIIARDAKRVAWCKRPAPVNGGRKTLRNGVKFREPTSYRREVQTIEYIEGTAVTLDDKRSKCTRTGNNCFRPWNRVTANHAGFGTGSNSDGRNESIVKCLNRLNEGKAQYGSFLAESVQTADLLASTSTDILRMLIALKKGKLMSKDFPGRKRAGDMWLEWQYGWRPLYDDVKGMYDDLQNGIKFPPLIHASSRVTSMREKTWTPTGYKSSSHSRTTDVFRTHIWAELSSRGLAVAQNMSLSPLSIGWELVPWSFAVDWFVPVGQTLQALTASAGLSFVGGFRSETNDYEFHGDGTGYGSVVLKEFVFDRTKLTSFPTGKLYARQKSPFNTTRVQNFLALLSQRHK